MSLDLDALLTEVAQLRTDLRISRARCASAEHIMAEDSRKLEQAVRERDAARHDAEYWKGKYEGIAMDQLAAAPEATADCGCPIERKAAVITRHSRECYMAKVARDFAASMEDEPFGCAPECRCKATKPQAETKAARVAEKLASMPRADRPITARWPRVPGNDTHDLTADDLPGMWEHADLTGGQTDAEPVPADGGEVTRG